MATMRSRFNRDSDASPIGGRSSREEERRKVLEIEEERLRREREVQLRRGVASAQIARSASRAGSQVRSGGVAKVNRGVIDADHESQYSGHSSSSAIRKEPKGINRYDQLRMGRVKRSTSNANSAVMGGANGVRREINRKKLPASVTSSLNSSESDQNGNRSVYLHAACVADIPPNEKAKRPPPRALSAESRENIALAGASNLQKSKKISRSISLLGPFKPKTTPRHHQTEIHYDNSAAYVNKPPKPPSRLGASRPDNKKSASSTDLLVEDNEAGPIIIGDATMPRRQSHLSGPNKVSRSVSMPKDTRLAGWFKKRKRV